MTVIPKKWMPNCSMKRVILHWTAGGYTAIKLKTKYSKGSSKYAFLFD